MGDSVKSNKFPLFSSTVTNLLHENAYLEITDCTVTNPLYENTLYLEN